MSRANVTQQLELVGLLPAAGRGSRLGVIPCSKEIMPLGFQLQASTGGVYRQPVTAIESHLQALKLAGARRAIVVIGEGKHDIVRYLGNGSRYGLSLAYLYQQQLRGMPFALELATAWVGSATTLFSMPDTLITPFDTGAQLQQYHAAHPADLTLGLFHTATPRKFGMVELDAAGRVVGFVDKPLQTRLELMWGLAAWSPRFSQFLARQVAAVQDEQREYVLSDVFQAALQAGLAIQAVVLEGARYHDIGTPEDFQAVVADLFITQAKSPE